MCSSPFSADISVWHELGLLSVLRIVWHWLVRASLTVSVSWFTAAGAWTERVPLYLTWSVCRSLHLVLWSTSVNMILEKSEDRKGIKRDACLWRWPPTARTSSVSLLSSFFFFEFYILCFTDVLQQALLVPWQYDCWTEMSSWLVWNINQQLPKHVSDSFQYDTNTFHRKNNLYLNLSSNMCREVSVC